MQRLVGTLTRKTRTEYLSNKSKRKNFKKITEFAIYFIMYNFINLKLDLINVVFVNERKQFRLCFYMLVYLIFFSLYLPVHFSKHSFVSLIYIYIYRVIRLHVWVKNNTFMHEVKNEQVHPWNFFCEFWWSDIQIFSKKSMHFIWFSGFHFYNYSLKKRWNLTQNWLKN